MTALATEEQVRRFVRRCEAPSTREAYTRELWRFASWAPRAPGPELIYDYRDHLKERGLTPTTVRWRVTVVRAFLAWLVEAGDADSALVEGIRLPRRKRSAPPRVLTKSELKSLLAAPDRRTWKGRRDAAILVCLGVGGLRAGEVCRLRLEDVVVTREECSLIVFGKGSHRRRVELPWIESALLRDWAKREKRTRIADSPVFRRSQDPAADELDLHAIRYVVSESATTAGLVAVHPHCLRHTAATVAIQAGQPLHRLRDWLGHSSIMATSRYLH